MTYPLETNGGLGDYPSHIGAAVLNRSRACERLVERDTAAFDFAFSFVSRSRFGASFQRDVERRTVARQRLARGTGLVGLDGQGAS
jgi:hypothetical protein